MPSKGPAKFPILVDPARWDPGRRQPGSAREQDSDRAFDAGSSLPPSQVAKDDESPSDSDDAHEGYPTVLCDDPNLCLRNGGLRLPPLLGLVLDGTTRTDAQQAACIPVSAAVDPEPQPDTAAPKAIVEVVPSGAPSTQAYDAAQPHTTFATALHWMPPEVGPALTSTRPVASTSSTKSRGQGKPASAKRPHRTIAPNVTPFPCKHCGLWFTSLFERSKHVKAEHKDVGLPPKNPLQEKRLPRCVPQYEGRRVIRLSADGSRVTEYLCAHCDRTFTARIPLKKHVKCDHGRG